MIKIFCIVFLFMSGFSSLALSDTDKNVTVDQAIGGMEEGRRISGPGSYSSKDIASEKHGIVANPVTDAHAHPFMQMMTGNRGYMYVNPGANSPQNATNQNGGQQANGAFNASTGTNPAQAGSSIPSTVQTHTGVEATGSTAGTVQTVTQQTDGSANVGTQAGQTVTEHTSGPVNTGTQTGQIIPEHTSGPVNVNTTGEAHGNGGNLIGGETLPVNAPTGQTVTGTTEVQTGNSSGTTTQEPSGTSGTSSNPIVSVEANTNPGAGTPNASIHTDTSGQLEDRQIVSAGVAGAVTGSTGTQVGSASEITGSNTVHNTDITTQPVSGTTGQTVPEQTGGSVNVNTGEEAHGNGGILTGGETSTVNAPTGTTTQEPSGTSSNPIVAVEANTNPGAGTPNASIHTDTSGQLEDRQIANAGVAGSGTGSSGTQVGSASETTGLTAVHNTNLTTESVTGTTGQTAPEQTGTTATIPTVSTPTGGTQEPSNTSNNPIVSVEAGTNSGSGTPTATVHTDTSGQLEDRQIVSAGVARAVTGSTGTQVGSASEITGSNTVHNTDVTTQPVTGTTGQTVPEQTGGSVATETGNQGYITGQAGTTETNPTGSVSTGGTQEPSGTLGTSNNPIVAVEADTNPTSGTPNASVHTDTSGQLEDRQIANVGVAGAGGLTGAQTGSTAEITGSNTVHNADVTTQPVTGTTGEIVPNTTEAQTGSGSSGTTTQEPSGTSGASNNPIVAVDAGTIPGSGTPNASVHTDTSGQLEDRQIVNAGVAGTVTGSTGVQVGSASEITGSSAVHNADVTTQPVTGTTGQTVPEQTGGSVTTQTGNQGYITGQAGTIETSSPTVNTSTSGTQEPSGTLGTSSNPIVSVEAGTNSGSGTPTATVHTDTSGQLEDRQIVNAGVAGSITGSTGAQVGSASEITGSSAVHNADITSQPVTGTTGQTIPEQTDGTVATQAQEGSATDVTGQELVQEADVTTEAPSTGPAVPGQTSAGSGTTTQEPSGTSGSPIVGVETGTNPESGMPNVGASVDTTGEVEDRQFLQTDLASEGVALSGQVGSASDTTGSSIVHGADITTQPVATTTGQAVTGTTEAQTGNGSSGTTAQEPSGTSSNPIVGVEAGTSPGSGTPNASVHTDTSGQLEDRQIVGAGVTGAVTGSTGAQVGSASEITGSGTIGGLDVMTQPVQSDISAPSGVGAEIDTTGQSVGGAADVGVQADVSGVSDSSDVAKKDSADGLNLGTTAHTGL